MIVLINQTSAIQNIIEIFIIFTHEKSKVQKKYTAIVTKKIEENESQLKISFGAL